MAEDPELVAYEAKEVQQFLHHDAVRKAFAATEARIVTQWKMALDLSPLEREVLWHKLQAFRDLQRELYATSQRKPHPED